MKTLSIRQPWAELILQGRKTIELRAWSTAYRGPLVIHAGWIIEEAECRACDLDPAALAHGVLVGVATLTAIERFTPASWAALRPQHLSEEADPGGWLGWRLADPRRLPELIPLRGQPGLFDLPEEVAAAVRAQLGL